MQLLFTTADVRPRDRFDYWLSAAREAIVDHDSAAADRAQFDASLQSESLGELDLLLFENAAMSVTHTARQAASANTDELFVCQQVQGSLGLEQGGREVVLEAGDITLLDPRLPYAGRFSADSRTFVLKAPRSCMEARIGRTLDLVAVPVRPSAAEGRIASSFLALLPPCAGQLRPPAAEIVSNQALDLIAISLAEMSHRGVPRVSCARSVARLKLHAVVEARLADPSLDAAAAASAAGLSVRYANAVLADEHLSVMRLIQARRLFHCRRALEDPALMHRTISDIAYGWGFSDMTHFGRRFKATYGMPPREFRMLRLTGRRECRRRSR
jgi:AraC-like DNA-binding protein